MVLSDCDLFVFALAERKNEKNKNINAIGISLKPEKLAWNCTRQSTIYNPIGGIIVPIRAKLVGDT
jgi:hypothetical protein